MSAAKAKTRGRGQPRSPWATRLLLRFRPSEFTAWTGLAQRRGMRLTEWVRQACYLAARDDVALMRGKVAAPRVTDEPLSERQQIRLRPEELEAWTELAEGRGLKLSTWIRQACYLAARDDGWKP